MNQISIEIFHGGRWHLAATYQDSASLSYDIDFAPMFLDPEGIPRSSRWDNETPSAMPDFGHIVEAVAEQVIAPAELRTWLGEEAIRVQQLPKTMQNCGVDGEIIEKMARRISDLESNLREVGQ